MRVKIRYKPKTAAHRHWHYVVVAAGNHGCEFSCCFLCHSSHLHGCGAAIVRTVSYLTREWKQRARRCIASTTRIDLSAKLFYVWKRMASTEACL